MANRGPENKAFSPQLLQALFDPTFSKNVYHMIGHVGQQTLMSMDIEPIAQLSWDCRCYKPHAFWEGAAIALLSEAHLVKTARGRNELRSQSTLETRAAAT